MQKAPQVEPVSNLQRGAPTILRKLEHGPVFLSQRGTLTAAIVSITEWDRIARRMTELEGLLEAKRSLARLDDGKTSTTSHEELKLLLQEKANQHVGN